MLGTLIRKDNKWFVKYPDVFTETEKTVEVGKKSLENKWLSTYWTEGREVEFERYMIWNVQYANIIHDDYSEEDAWDRIDRELSEQEICGVHDTMQWLRINYNAPIKK